MVSCDSCAEVSGASTTNLISTSFSECWIYFANSSPSTYDPSFAHTFRGSNGAVAVPPEPAGGKGVTPVCPYLSGVAAFASRTGLDLATGFCSVTMGGSEATTIRSVGVRSTGSGFTFTAGGVPAATILGGGAGLVRTTTGFGATAGRTTLCVLVSTTTGAAA